LFETALDGSGSPLIAPLLKAGIVVGVKMDDGPAPVPNSSGEVFARGLDRVHERCAQYYAAGARFVKWQMFYHINPARGTPSASVIAQQTSDCALYASIAQSHGLVPIVEPEVKMDGAHSLAQCAYWTERIITALYKALSDRSVLLEGSLIKPNMVTPGKDSKEFAQMTAQEVGRATVRALQRSVPVAVPGIMFLSGGLNEEQSAAFLQAMNESTDPALGARPWALSFSFGRALQTSCLAAWKANKDNFAAGQVLPAHCPASELGVRACSRAAAG
jgi:fructose-bisphosphate aldolase, class I